MAAPKLAKMTDASGADAERSADDIVVSVKRTIADYRDAYAWLRWHSWRWPVNIIVGPLAVTAFVFFRYGLVGGILCLVVDAIVLLIYYYASLASITSRMQRAHEQHGPPTYTFTPDGFDYQSETGSSATEWLAINRGVETRLSYLLFHTNATFFLIPKSCVPAAQRDHLRSLLKEHLGGRMHFL